MTVFAGDTASFHEWQFRLQIKKSLCTAGFECSIVFRPSCTSGISTSRPGSVVVQKSGRVDDDVQISALDAFCEMDGRKSRYTAEVLERYRGEDVGDLKRSEWNELVEKCGHVSTLSTRKFLKSDPKVVT